MWVHQNPLSREWGRAIAAQHDRQKKKKRPQCEGKDRT